jgi:hypothetical protein
VTGGGSVGGLLTVVEGVADKVGTKELDAVADLLKKYTHYDEAWRAGVMQKLGRATGKLHYFGAQAAKISKGISIVSTLAALSANYQNAQAQGAIAKMAISGVQEGVMFAFGSAQPLAALADAVFGLVPGVKAPIGSTMKASINTILTMFEATINFAQGDLEAASGAARSMHEYLEEEGNGLFQTTQDIGEMIASDKGAQWGAEGLAETYGEPGYYTLNYVVEPAEWASSTAGAAVDSLF